MCRFYGFTIEELLEMKRNHFWGLYEQIPAVKAAEELDMLSIMRSAFHAKNVKDFANRLQIVAKGYETVNIGTIDRNMG